MAAVAVRRHSLGEVASASSSDAQKGTYAPPDAVSPVVVGAVVLGVSWRPDAGEPDEA